MYTPKQILKTYYGYDSFRPLQEGIICHVLQRKDAQCAFPPILTEIKKPSGSQRTVMYISVLFAISSFTQQKREEDYPLIFDAATSSFGDSKEGEFYNVISNVKKQCIIVTKDFITKGEVRRNDIQGLECPVYRIKKAKGFDANNMATIRTIVEKLK